MHHKSSGWLWSAGVAHALVGVTLLFLTMHPLRDALAEQPLELVKIMSAVQAINGLAVMLLVSLGCRPLAPGLVALGTALACLMIWIIAFTGQHPFDPLVPIGGLMMIAGWLKLLFEAPPSSSREG